MDTVTHPQDVVGTPPPVDVNKEDLAIEIASQWKLMWWKFRKHRLAVTGAIVVIAFYIVAIFAEFFAPVTTSTYQADYAFAPPQAINLIHDGRFQPYVNGYKFERDPVSFKKVWVLDEETIIPIGFFVRGEP
ncbi:MAG TPA: hypothetical protein VHO69_05310, partial [Phototrophicaceae bacterium]|nr:hypothetical protein [Phototrophicaceae bacterium]